MHALNYFFTFHSTHSGTTSFRFQLWFSLDHSALLYPCNHHLLFFLQLEVIGLLAAFLIKNLLILTGLRLRRLKDMVNTQFMTEMESYLGSKIEVKHKIGVESSPSADTAWYSTGCIFSGDFTVSCTHPPLFAQHDGHFQWIICASRQARK